jgi:hypothetical protein
MLADAQCCHYRSMAVAIRFPGQRRARSADAGLRPSLVARGDKSSGELCFLWPTDARCGRLSSGEHLARS